MQSKGAFLVPRSFSRSEKTEAPLLSALSLSQMTGACEEGDMEKQDQFRNKSRLTGTVGGSSPPATCLPVMRRRLELRTMLPFFPSEYQRRLKSATNDLPVSCFIFVTDFLHGFLQDQSLCHILLSFHEYSLLSSVLYSPLHIIDLITQVK